MNAYKIIAKANGKFGVQRFGSDVVHGNFSTWAEAAEAIGLSQCADQAAYADAEQY